MNPYSYTFMNSHIHILKIVPSYSLHPIFLCVLCSLLCLCSFAQIDSEFLPCARHWLSITGTRAFYLTWYLRKVKQSEYKLFPISLAERSYTYWCFEILISMMFIMQWCEMSIFSSNIIHCWDNSLHDITGNCIW